uniref:Large ribosomal subunit protein bL21m n=1 Tax=Aegilops tauschii subsp. strangulata TaxID=200361 RepID=A0A452ZV75_AEGTS
GKTEEEKLAEANEIGYKVVGPLGADEKPFKPYEPVFAVVQIGSHQFKVSNGDSIFTERLKFCDVNDKLVLNRVLMLGSQAQTIIGRPILTDATVHAVVEEHALDAKVIIFKKKRRKNYRRTRGHRQVFHTISVFSHYMTLWTLSSRYVLLTVCCDNSRN